jgi:hypothetical protein
MPAQTHEAGLDLRFFRRGDFVEIHFQRGPELIHGDDDRLLAAGADFIIVQAPEREQHQGFVLVKTTEEQAGFRARSGLKQ